MPLTADDKLLVHLPIPPPPGWLETVKERFPSLQVRWEVARLDESIPDIESADKLPADVLDGVTLLCVYPPASPDNMRKVRYVQLASAGYDRWLKHPRFLDPGVMFCNGSGAHPPQIAEWVIATWLAHKHNFALYAEQQRAHLWKGRMDKPVTEASGRRMGILGYGAIGRQCARYAQALGVEVYAYTRTPRRTPASRRLAGYCVPGTGDPDGAIPARWFHGDPRDALADMLANHDVDVLLVCLPLHESTRGLLGEEQFRLMGRRKTFLSNIARGPIVDSHALVRALREGWVGGAALDVADPEPLPADHPLWDAPNVFITPHISWASTEVMPRVADIVLTNLGRLHQGLPPLNLVQKP